MADDGKERLIRALEDEALNYEVAALDGARASLEELAAAGVRRALICDTGFSPGRVVRTLLDRVGLLPLLEVTIFSDEVGVPKPDPTLFTQALRGLSAEAAGAVHVGDIRRSDIAGARAVGMGTVRLAMHHDDGDSGPNARAGVIGCDAAGCAPHCERPEADAVARSYPELMTVLGFHQ
jgi:putative hydrolase of the HAD superfamily